MKRDLSLLTSIWFISCLLLLLLNDFILKKAYHNWFTGKLSDFAGLFIFSLFWTVLIPQHKKVIFWLTACGFIYWKSPFSQAMVEEWNYLGLLQLERVEDYSDYLALFVLPISYIYEERRDSHYRLSIIPHLPLVIAPFAFIATSQAKRIAEPIIDYSSSYQVKHVARDSLISQLNHSGLKISYSNPNNTIYPNEYAQIDRLNDNIESITMRIGDFDTVTQTVAIELGTIVYNDSIYAEYDEKRLDGKYKLKLQQMFEEQVIKKISRDAH